MNSLKTIEFGGMERCTFMANIKKIKERIRLIRFLLHGYNSNWARR